jgi:hypothetical protein
MPWLHCPNVRTTLIKELLEVLHLCEIKLGIIVPLFPKGMPFSVVQRNPIESLEYHSLGGKKATSLRVDERKYVGGRLRRGEIWFRRGGKHFSRGYC